MLAENLGLPAGLKYPLLSDQLGSDVTLRCTPATICGISSVRTICNVQDMMAIREIVKLNGLDVRACLVALFTIWEIAVSSDRAPADFSVALLDLLLLGLKQSSKAYNAQCRGIITNLVNQCPEYADQLRHNAELNKKQRSEIDKCLSPHARFSFRSISNQDLFDLVVEAYQFESAEVQECLLRIEGYIPVSYRKQLVQKAFAEQSFTEHCLRLLEAAERVQAFGDETLIEMSVFVLHADPRIREIAIKQAMANRQARLQSKLAVQ
jgi:hypothetical protein